MGEDKVLSLTCGKVSDEMALLKHYCMINATSLLVLGSNIEDWTVTFWTEDYPELIGICRFCRDSTGKLTFNLDYSQSTL